MLDLRDREWTKFRLGDIFALETGKGKGLNHLRLDNQGISYLGATNRNNGVMCFVSREESMVQRGNGIAFIRNGEGSIGYSVYKTEAFVASSDLTIGYSDRLNRFNALFITTIADTVRGKYHFNYKRSDTRLSNESLLLPITSDGTPDWQFMEDYIREREQGLAQQYVDHAERILRECDVDEVVSLKEKAWGEFVLNDIFATIQRGKRLKTADHKKGYTPYVSSTAFNNGVDAFISNRAGVRRFDHCLTIANSGSVGKTFYHPYEFVASDHVTQLKNPIFSPYIYLFLTAIISRLEEKYSFNREMNDLRIRKDKMFLPIDENGEPDWAYMEQYAKSIMGQQLRAYLTHTTRQ